MATHLNILNSRESKKALADMDAQWGAHIEGNYAFLQNKEGKLFALSKDAGRIDLSQIRADAIGLYVADYEKNGDIRLSIEGSELVGPKATKNTVNISNEKSREWLQGNDIPTESTSSGFVIIKSENYFLGCGKIKNGMLLNFVPKTRRVTSTD